MFENKSKKRGFGIIEVLIASTIIVVILFALTAAGRSSLSGSIRVQERAQATYLAQQGIEAVRQIRDKNWIDANPITNWGILQQFANNNAIKVIAENNDGFSLVDESGTNADKVLDNLTFHRTVKFEPAGNLIPSNAGDALNVTARDQNSIKITVSITWSGSESGISISEVLTNWRPDY